MDSNLKFEKTPSYKKYNLMIYQQCQYSFTNTKITLSNLDLVCNMIHHKRSFYDKFDGENRNSSYKRVYIQQLVKGRYRHKVQGLMT